MNTAIDRRLIFLNSKYGYSVNDTYNSNVQFSLTGFDLDHDDIVSVNIELINTQIPVSFYNINYTNNVLNYAVSGVNYSAVLTRGNYTGYSLITELQTQFITNGHTFSISINKINGCISFTCVGLEYFLLAGSTILDVLGFQLSGDISASAGNILSPYPLNLLCIMALVIKSQALQTYSFSNTSTSNILTTLSVDKSQFQLLNYQSKGDNKLPITNTTLDNIDIQILDQNDNFINFNNQNWTITLALNITKIYNPRSIGKFSDIVKTFSNIPPIPTKISPNVDNQNKPPEPVDDTLDLLTNS